MLVPPGRRSSRSHGQKEGERRHGATRVVTPRNDTGDWGV